MGKTRRSEWEVALLPGPPGSGEALLVVVDLEHGSPRRIEPLSSEARLEDELRKAATEPMGLARPGAPAKIRCVATDRERLEPAARALGAKIQVVDQLPGVFALIGAATGSDDVGPVPLPPNPKDWLPIRDRMLAVRPWRDLSDAVEFRFQAAHPELAEAIGLVLGNAGEQLGVVIYPTVDDLEAFYEVAYGGALDLHDEFECLCAHLDPVVEFDDDDLGLLDAQGLIKDGLALLVSHLSAAGFSAVEAEREVWMRAAVEAILGLCIAHGPVLEVEAKSIRVRTEVGWVTVTSLPPEPEAPVSP